MKKLILLLAFSGVYAQEETQVFKLNESGVKEIQSSQIIIEYEFKTEIYKVNESGVREILPEVVIEKRNEQDVDPINYIEPEENKNKKDEIKRNSK